MLKGQQVTLRAMTHDDLDLLCQFNNDLEVELAEAEIHRFPNLSLAYRPSLSSRSARADEMARVSPSRPMASLSAHVLCSNSTPWHAPVP